MWKNDDDCVLSMTNPSVFGAAASQQLKSAVCRSPLTGIWCIFTQSVAMATNGLPDIQPSLTVNVSESMPWQITSYSQLRHSSEARILTEAH